MENTLRHQQPYTDFSRIIRVKSEYIKEGQKTKEGVFETNIFGKSIGELMEDGMRSKIAAMDDECQLKLQDTMQKIVNDNNGGLICIIIR